MVIVSEYTLCGIGNVAVIKVWLVVRVYKLFFLLRDLQHGDKCK